MDAKFAECARFAYRGYCKRLDLADISSYNLYVNELLAIWSCSFQHVCRQFTKTIKALMGLSRERMREGTDAKPENPGS